jgi:hypothetical protein
MDLAPLLALLPHLGLNAEHVLAWVTIAMTAATVIAKVLDYLVPRLTAYATTTPQAWDDRLAARLAWVLGFLHAILPRVAVGPRPTKPVDPRGTAAIVLLLAIGLAGCGGRAENVARTTLATGAHGIVVLDEAAAAKYREIEERCDASADSYEAWIECMRPADRVEASLRGAAHVLRGAEATIDATDAEGLRRVAPCVARVLGELASALEAVGIQMPESLSNVLRITRGIGGMCEGGS